MNRAEYFTPCVTVFDEKGRVDEEANLRVWDAILSGGVDGIVLLGSIGEFFALEEDEKLRLIRLAATHVKPRAKLFVGTGCMMPGQTIRLSNQALDLGADAVMIIGPYFFALSDAAVEAYYDEVARAVHGPIFLYNFPDRTGYDLSPQVTLSLLRRHENIIGYKDSVSLPAHTRDLLGTIRPEYPDFRVYSGFDDQFMSNLLSGGNGCIGGLSNIDPALIAAWTRAVNTGDMEQTARIQRIINRMMDLYAVSTPFVPAIKEAMRLCGLLDQTVCARPTPQLTEDQAGQVEGIMNTARSLRDALPIS